MSTKRRVFSCSECKDKVYTTHKKLSNHIRIKHGRSPSPIAYRKNIHNFKCLEGCDISYKRRLSLIQHLKMRHGMEFEITQYTLFSMAEFDVWKQMIEKETNSYYNPSAKKNRTAMIFRCNRNVKIGREGRDDSIAYERNLKSQGSCKMRNHCTSVIQLNVEADKIIVFWTKSHYGHKCDPQHIRLSKIDRDRIANKLTSGMSPSEVLKSEKSNQSDGQHELKRTDFLTIRDIGNIAIAYNIRIKRQRSPSSSRKFQPGPTVVARSENKEMDEVPKTRLPKPQFNSSVERFENSADLVELFFSNLEEAVEKQNVILTRGIIKSCLVGEAKTFFDATKEKNPKKLVTMFKQHFALKPSEAWKILIEKMWNTSENVKIHFSKLEELARLSGIKEDSIKTVALRMFVHNLPTEISQMLPSSVNTIDPDVEQILMEVNKLIK